MAGSTGTSRAFERALLSFRNKLLHEEIQAFTGTTLEDIRKQASAIQDLQEKKGMLRNMRRIQPLINGLTQFSGVIEVFVQSKPEVLAFIWGPIKFLLQVVSSYTEAFDKLLDAFQTLGENLSRFQVYEKTFLDVPRMQDVIVMIYEDILRFYQATLNFFREKCWRRLFRSLWNTFNDKFGNILSDLDRHKELVDREASTTHIAEARAARQAAQKAEETTRAYREKQNLLQIKIWLGPVDYDAFLAKLRSPYSTITGLWFVQENGVQEWLDKTDNSKRLLWLTGIPGAGKTFLSASFLRHTQSIYEGKNVPIAYAFLRHDSDNTFAMIMLTLISQLLHHNLQQLAYFDEMRESKTHPPSSQEEVQEMFKFILGNIGVSYIFIDGLDEIDIDKRKMVLDTLCYLLTEAENLKIFLSSRDEVDISTSLTNFNKHIHRVDLAGKNQQDIKTYIAEEGKEVFRRFSLDDDTRQQIQDILDEVCDKAEGMFLWARLVIIDLKGQVNIEGLEDAARHLPVGLDEAYGRILNRIKEKLSQTERDLARRVLGWVVCSTRPLSLNELKHAMAIDIDKEDRCINKKRIILRRLDELCGPVIEFDAEDKIHFVHFTAKEYLTSKYSGMFISHSNAHQDIAITCIRYLSFSCFDLNITDDKVKENVLSGEYCLHLYAERNWMYHVNHAILELDRDSGSTESLASLLVKFVQLRLSEDPPQAANQAVPSEWRFLESLKSPPNVQRHLIDYCIFNSGEGLSKGILSDPLTLQKSTQKFRQHLEDIFTLSKKSNDQDQLQSIYRNYGGNIFKCSRVQCFHYVNGFDAEDKRDKHLNTHIRPFLCHFQWCDFASFGFGTMEAFKAHLQRYHQTHVSNIDTQTGGPSSLSTSPPLRIPDLTTLLFDAISTGNVSRVKDVLELGVDLNCGIFNNNGESFLHYTLALGHNDIFELLLEKGASADTLDRGPSTTILNSAIAKGLKEYVELLLEWGAGVDRLKEGVSAGAINVSTIPPPLIVAVQNNQSESAQLLLENGAAVDLPDGNGNVALIYAVKISPDIVELLLEKGASANPISSAGNPALIIALRNNQSESARLLLGKGADVDLPDGNGDVALIYAIRWCPDTVELLLEKGASANTISSAGNPALIVALRNNQSELARLLLEQGADVDLPDRKGDAALIHAVSNSPETPDIIKILLEQGVSVDTVSSDGTPALILAIKYGQMQSLRFLLEEGADVDLPDRKGDAALIHAVSNSPDTPDIIKILLEQGVSVDTVSSDGTPALILAIKYGQMQSLRLLLEEGADVDLPDRKGDAALIHAVSNSSETPDIIKVLLEQGAIVDTVSSDGTPALILAIKYGQMQSFRLLLEQGADVDSKDRYGNAALIHAVSTLSSPTDIVKVLLEQGANVNIVSPDGTPALILAIQNRWEESAQLLIELGANVDSTDRYGNAALIHAVKQSSLATVKSLLEKGASADTISPERNPAALVALLERGSSCSPIVQRLLEKGEYIDAHWKDKGSEAAVRAAQLYTDEKLEIMKLLILKYHVSPNAKDYNGTPILVIMTLQGQSSCLGIAEFLMSEGAERDPDFNVDLIGPGIREKVDALFGAIYTGMIKMVKILIEKNVRVNAKDHRTEATPLIAALLSPYYEYEILEMLLNAGAAVDYVNKRTDDSALLLAAQRITADSGADALKLLLRHDANINMTDRKGQTALHKMAEKKYIFAARTLLEHGARADIPNKQGKTALTIWPELNQTILSTTQSSLQSSVPLSMDET